MVCLLFLLRVIAVSILFSALLCLMSGDKHALALDEPGDRWVFTSDRPVALERTYNQFKPAVSGNLVFWEDNRPGEQPQTFSRILYKDLARPDEPERPLTPAPGYYTGTYKGQKRPSTAGGLVAWEEMVTLESGGKGYQIRYIDTAGGCLERQDCQVQSIAANFIDEPRPTVSRGRIVWQADSGGASGTDIYMYDTGNGVITPVCAEMGEQEDPDVDGDWVAWIDNREGETVRSLHTMNDLYIKNVFTGEERRVTYDGDDGNQGGPAISGGVVTYSEYRSSDTTRRDIKAYDIASGTTLSVFTGDGIDQRPDIDGRIIVWEACPSGINSCGVWMHDLDTGISQQVSAGPVDPAGNNISNAGFPAVSSGRIVWQDDRDGVRVIYENRLGERAQVLAERHRPELRLSIDENFDPGPVELMLGLPGSFLRRWPNEGFEPVRNPGFADLEDSCREAACYVDLLGSAVEAGGGESSCSVDRGIVSRTYMENYRSYGGAYQSVVYARVKPLVGGAVVQYWINYAVNDHPKLFHEGDWEMVQVRLDENLTPYRADYSQHSSGQWREWQDVAKQDSAGERPVVYVAAGSHASYFRSGEFELVPFLAWDTADGKGDSISPQIQVIPELGAASGVFSWLAFEGRWGERTDAVMCLPSIPGVFDPTGHRDGPPGPAFQGAKWNDPLGWLEDAACDGCEAVDGESTVLGVISFAGGDIQIYDADGDYLGGNADGGTDDQVRGAELLEYSIFGGVGAIMSGADATSGYRVELIGAGSGSVYVTVPYRVAGRVDSVRFDLVENGGTARMSLDLNGHGGYTISVDVDGDDSTDYQIFPAHIETRYVDLMSPMPVTDISVVETAVGTTSLTFTSPGAGDPSGAASTYDLRYSQAPIDAWNWNDALPLRTPGPASPPGEKETITVTGLQGGTQYYFAVRSIDDAGRSSTISNVASCRTRAPELAWYLKSAYWGSFDDYLSRSLTVDFEVRNKGTATAIATRIETSVAAPSGCFALSPMPMQVGDIDVDSGRKVTIKYRIPAGTLGLLTSTYASCRDVEGGDYWFPEALQQN